MINNKVLQLLEVDSILKEMHSKVAAGHFL